MVIQIVIWIEPIIRPLKEAGEHIRRAVGAVADRAEATHGRGFSSSVGIQISMIGGREVASPREAPSVRPPGCFLPLGFRGQALTIKTSIGCGAKPGDIHYRKILLPRLDLKLRGSTRAIVGNLVKELRRSSVSGLMVLWNEILKRSEVIKGNPGPFKLPHYRYVFHSHQALGQGIFQKLLVPLVGDERAVNVVTVDVHHVARLVAGVLQRLRFSLVLGSSNVAPEKGASRHEDHSLGGRRLHFNLEAPLNDLLRKGKSDRKGARAGFGWGPPVHFRQIVVEEKTCVGCPLDFEVLRLG